MTHRATYALDEKTAERIRRLAAEWGVSQAEVIRRAVAQSASPAPAPDPVAELQSLLESGQGLGKSEAKAYLSEVQEDRKTWRDQ